MAAADSLRLKVSQAEYERRIGVLDSKINSISSLLGEYQQLKQEADQVLGENDSNLNKLKMNVENNIKAVKGQYELLKESRTMLQKQMEELGSLSSNVQEMLTQAAETAKTAFNTMKIVGDMVE